MDSPFAWLYHSLGCRRYWSCASRMTIAPCLANCHLPGSSSFLSFPFPILTRSICVSCQTRLCSFRFIYSQKTSTSTMLLNHGFLFYLIISRLVSRNSSIFDELRVWWAMWLTDSIFVIFVVIFKHQVVVSSLPWKYLRKRFLTTS